MNRRSATLAIVALSLTALTACGTSAPPAEELALEAVEALLLGGEIDESAAECMRGKIEAFSLTDEQAAGFENLDDVASKADGGNELAQNIIDDFEAALSACN